MGDAVEVRIKEFQNNFVPAFYETYASILSFSDDIYDLNRALALAKESAELLDAPEVHDRISLILKKRDA
jgi:hypothetical protein